MEVAHSANKCDKKEAMVQICFPEISDYTQQWLVQFFIVLILLANVAAN